MRTIFLVIFFILTQILSGVQEPQHYKIGVLAKRGEVITMARWQPTAEYLSQKLSPLTFEIVPLDFNEIFTSVENGEVDFILANSS